MPDRAERRLVRAVRLVLAVDVSPWLRPDADTSSDRSFCRAFGRRLGKHQMVPGWPYSIVAALETGRTSWTALLDAIRLEPGADLAAVTAGQVREVIERLIGADQWRDGDPDVLIVLDAGYDAPRIAHLLADLPVEVLGRLRSDRVLRKPVPVPWISPPQGGRPPEHGGEFIFGDPATWGEATAATVTNADGCGTATAQAWDWLHPRLTRRAAWLDHEGPLPIDDLIHGGTETNSATALLRAGGSVWASTILAFSLLYSELDSGGPAARAHHMPTPPALAFPQQLSPELNTSNWRPRHVDYLYLGYTNSTALSPTDVMPLAPWAKSVMTLQSIVSLVILGLVVARAVNVLA